MHFYLQFQSWYIELVFNLPLLTGAHSLFLLQWTTLVMRNTNWVISPNSWTMTINKFFALTLQARELNLFLKHKNVVLNWSCWCFCRRMLKAPLLKSSGLHFSVFQDKSERGAFTMFKKYVWNSSKIRKKVENALCLIKKFNNVHNVFKI